MAEEKLQYTLTLATKASGTGAKEVAADLQKVAAMSTQAADKANLFLQMKEFAGMPVPSFLGIPVRTVDRILETETALT